jgi:hypothetical protein
VHFFGESDGQACSSCYHQICLFSVPAPPTRSNCVRRGFLLLVGSTLVWRLTDHIAQLTLPPLAGSLDASLPSEGLGELQLQEQPVPAAHILGIGLKGMADGRPPVDSYIRQPDFVAEYATSELTAVDLQVTWRAFVDATALCGIEAIISVRTDLLDSDPQAAASSCLPADQVLSLTAETDPHFQLLQIHQNERVCLDANESSGAFLFRLHSSPYSYLEMVHPNDFVTIEFARQTNSQGILSTQFSMFDERLEKGVIRRGRLRGIFLPREEDTAQALQCYHQFLDSAVPLST